MDRLGQTRRLDLTDFKVESDATPNYNCVAWAVHHETQAIWPDDQEQFGWPPDVPRTDSVQAFEQFFCTLGFEKCESRVVEAGFEKIAIYAEGNEVTHVARQLNSGKWTSKMGAQADGTHKLESLFGLFGPVVLTMKRPASGRPRLPELHPPPSQILISRRMP